MVIYLGPALPQASCGLPGNFPARPEGRARRAGRPCSLLDLAPGGVCRAFRVATEAVGSYPAVSPLPSRPKTGAAVCFLWHFPPVARCPRYGPPCPLESGLSSGGGRPKTPPPATMRKTLLAKI